MDFGMVNVVGITVICYLVGLAVKATGLNNKWIPSIVGAVGGGLGIVGLFVMAGFPAEEPLTACAVGIASGLAATGIDQAVRQVKEN